MKKGFLFIVILMIWIIGTIGGAGYCFYVKQWPCAIAVIANGVLAFPTVRAIYKDSQND